MEHNKEYLSGKYTNRFTHKLHELKPYPFLESCDDNEVYAKINVGINELKIIREQDLSQIRISLMNKTMLKIDEDFFLYNVRSEENNYRPYFYEYFAEVNGDIISKLLNFLNDDNGNEWFECILCRPNDDIKEGSLIFNGYVFFSASPFIKRQMQLVFKNKKHNAEINKMTDKIISKLRNELIRDKGNWKLTSVLKTVDCSNSNVKVYNVEQGNCIEIQNDSHYSSKVIFDIGYAMSDWDETHINDMQDRVFMKLNPSVVT